MKKNLLKNIFWEYLFPLSSLFGLIYFLFFYIEIKSMIVRVMLFFCLIFFLLLLQSLILNIARRKNEGFRGW